MAETDSWPLGELLEGMVTVPERLMQIPVSGLAVDSRQVKAGDLFFALSGSVEHGACYIRQALERGAVAVLYETGVELTENLGIAVEGLRGHLGRIASRFHHHPSSHLDVVAVTGTDGKSSVVWLIASALERLHGGAALLGTVENRMVSGAALSQPVTHTTPPPVQLQTLLAEVVAAGGHSVAMEASSHGIEQQRLSGIALRSAVLTQLGRDHLDYHGSMAAYRAAKRALFDHPGLASIVVNLDDELGQQIAQHSSVEQVVGYSLTERSASLYGEIIRQDSEGMLLSVQTQRQQVTIHPALFGQFNASNLLAVIGLLLSWGYPLEKVATVVETLSPPQGRMETFRDQRQQRATLMVDYAHTSGALEAALRAVRQHLTEAQGALWVVFGCGGERDRGKRPEMGAVAERLADHIVLTNDNPRGEDPAAIIAEIRQGAADPQSFTVIEAREAAIEYAYRKAAAGDVILVAGKGHEQWQQIGEERIPYSDRKVAARLVSEESV